MEGVTRARIAKDAKGAYRWWLGTFKKDRERVSRWRRRDNEDASKLDYGPAREGWNVWVVVGVSQLKSYARPAPRCMHFFLFFIGSKGQAGRSVLGLSKAWPLTPMEPRYYKGENSREPRGRGHLDLTQGWRVRSFLPKERYGELSSWRPWTVVAAGQCGLPRVRIHCATASRQVHCRLDSHISASFSKGGSRDNNSRWNPPLEMA